MRFEVTLSALGDDGTTMVHYSRVEDVAPPPPTPEGEIQLQAAFGRLFERFSACTEEARKSIEVQAVEYTDWLEHIVASEAERRENDDEDETGEDGEQ